MTINPWKIDICPNCETEGQMEETTFTDTFNRREEGFKVTVEHLNGWICNECNRTMITACQFKDNTNLVDNAYAKAIREKPNNKISIDYE